MKKQTCSCDFERLRLLLANELTPEFEEATTAHIASCPNCQQVMESLAGDENWWLEVRSSLQERGRPEESGWNSGDNHPPEQQGQPKVVSDDQQAVSNDFAVEFLEPCATKGTLGKLGEIEILELIGRGGMGVVLKGYQRELGRYVAVKLMAPHLATAASARRRFAREARAAAAIVHPHVMAIHSVNGTGQLPYLVMPFVDCESLQQRLDHSGPLGLTEILRLGRQIALGLAAAHAQGLVHRDVKPANILMEKGIDRVMLTDFGLARAIDDASVTRSGVIAGTPLFMSPEQSRGEAIDARSDLFSLGSVLYTMGTGRPPFRAETSFGVLRRISDTEPRPLQQVHSDLPGWLEVLVGKLLQKNPNDRYSSAEEVAELLQRCLSHIQQPNAVPLPESLEKTEARPSPTQSALKIGMIGLTSLAATAIAIAVIKRSIDHRQVQSPPDAAPRQVYPTESPTNSRWQDNIGGQITELQNDTDQLQTQATRTWDKSVRSVIESANSNTVPSDEDGKP